MTRTSRLVPAILSAMLIAAHFFRAGNIGLVIFSILAPLILIGGKRWAVVVVQVLLVLASAEWLRTAYAIAQERAAIGAPTMRMFLILGSVAILTPLSTLPLRGAPRAREDSALSLRATSPEQRRIAPCVRGSRRNRSGP